jgi:Flp pilus assembly protein TadD
VHRIVEDVALSPEARVALAAPVELSARARGFLAAAAGRHEEAVTRYREALRDEDEDPTLHRELASSLWMLTRRDEAQLAARAAADRCLDSDCVIRHVAGDFEGRRQLVLASVAGERGLTRLARPSSALYNYVGSLRERRGELAGAEQAYRAAIERLPSNTHAVANLALLRLAKGDHAGARALIEPPLAAGEATSALLRAAGTIYYTVGASKKAALAFTRLLDREPDDGLARYNLGLIKLDRGDLSGALAELVRASELRSDDFRVWGNLGAARAATGDIQGARQAFARALELKPDDPIARRALAALPTG